MTPSLGIRRAGRLLVAFVALALPACANKVTPVNYERILNGMSEETVVEILGQPTRTSESEGVRTLVWEGGGNTITAQFRDGQLFAQKGTFAGLTPPETTAPAAPPAMAEDSGGGSIGPGRAGGVHVGSDSSSPQDRRVFLGLGFVTVPADR